MEGHSDKNNDGQLYKAYLSEGDGEALRKIFEKYRGSVTQFQLSGHGHNLWGSAVMDTEYSRNNQLEGMYETENEGECGPGKGTTAGSGDWKR